MGDHFADLQNGGVFRDFGQDSGDIAYDCCDLGKMSLLMFMFILRIIKLLMNVITTMCLLIQSIQDL